MNEYPKVPMSAFKVVYSKGNLDGSALHTRLVVATSLEKAIEAFQKEYSTFNIFSVTDQGQVIQAK